MGAQHLLDAFYDIDNLVTISITVPISDWQALKTAEPRGNWGYKGSRYDWYKTTSVSISGSKITPAGTFNNVGIIKKSFWGSFSKTKPSLRLDFGKYDDNEDAVQALIGTHRLTLNNSIQDPSYIRQPLGYELFRLARLPSFRCNFAKVIVNEIDIGVYVNLEPMQKRFVENRFRGNNNGNAYEVEWVPILKDELAYIRQDYVSFEGFSDFEDEKDLILAADLIAEKGLDGANAVIDMDDFIAFFAMEALLKHWDGFTHGLNNTYIYNDVEAVGTPSKEDVNLKFIPSGIDQILQRDRPFEIGQASAISKLIVADDKYNKKLFDRISKTTKGLFGVENFHTVLMPFTKRLHAVLLEAGIGIETLGDQIDIVTTQLQGIRDARFSLQGVDIVLDLGDDL